MEDAKRVEVAPGEWISSLDEKELAKIWAESESAPYRIPEDRRKEIIEEATSEKYAVPVEFAKRLLKNAVSDHSIALTQASRLFQYYLFSDDRGRISRPADFRGQPSRALTRYRAIEDFVDRYFDGSIILSGAEAAYPEELGAKFPGLSFSQLGFLCKEATLFSTSAAMRDVSLGLRAGASRPFRKPPEEQSQVEVPSEIIGGFLRMRHGTGYLSTEAAADEPEAYFSNKNLTEMEMWHEVILSRLDERIVNLWKMKAVHPMAFLILLRELEGFIDKTLRPLRSATTELGGYSNTKKKANLTKAMDEVLRANYLKLRHGRAMSWDNVVGVVSPKAPNKRSLGNMYSRTFRELTWFPLFASATEEDKSGLKHLLSMPGEFETHLAGLEETDRLLRRRS
ncbi:MAG: hypothetical protein EOP84_09975 [Verrucomicrobiaceae bacterium]|nr:MAG: hypothetical protein EOP84_09975 [Verrucomicrobiaceae bacterium]